MKNKQFIDTPCVSAAFLSSLSVGAQNEISACHDRYEILYVSSGHGRFIIEGEEFVLAPKVLFLTRPLEYGIMSLDEKCDFERYLISFDRSALSFDGLEILDAMLEVADCGGVYYPAELWCADIDSVFDRFSIAERLPEKEQGAMARALISELLALLSAVGGKRLLHADDTLFSRVTRYINANIHRDLSLDTLSHRFFVSKYYLCRAFKQQSGASIHSYINQKRVLYAKQLIESGETASRAADKVGFGDYSAFYRAYTKYQGASPVTVKPKGGSL